MIYFITNITTNFNKYPKRNKLTTKEQKQTVNKCLRNRKMKFVMQNNKKHRKKGGT